MNRNQFVYTRKMELLTGDGEKQEVEVTDSFSIEKVVRAITIDGGQVLILLDDIHERPMEVPVYNKKNERTGSKLQRQVVQSEIYLSPEDGERFFKLLNVKE